MDIRRQRAYLCALILSGITLVPDRDAAVAQTFDPAKVPLRSADRARPSEKWEQVRTFPIDDREGLRFGRFCAEGRRVVGRSESGRIIVFDTASGKELFRLDSGIQGLRPPAVSPDGKRLL